MAGSRVAAFALLALLGLCALCDAVGTDRRTHHTRSHRARNKAFGNWDQHADKIRVGGELGAGSIGSVAELDVTAPIPSIAEACGVNFDTDRFAFKTFGSDKAFEAEATVYEHLCENNCKKCPPGVMRYFGRATINGKKGIVLERVEASVFDYVTVAHELKYDTLCPMFGYEPVCPNARFLLVKQLARDMFTAIQSLQARGVVHMDIKPANIFIRQLEGSRQFIVGDMGNADVKQGEVRVKSAGGSDAYAPKDDPPRDVGFDLYCVGTSLDELLNANTRTTAGGNNNINAMYDDMEFDFSYSAKDKAKKPPKVSETLNLFEENKLSRVFPASFVGAMVRTLNKLVTRDATALSLIHI